MARQAFKLPLSRVAFPGLANEFGDTLPAGIRNLDGPEGAELAADKTRGPQLVFAQNIMPTPSGVAGVGILPVASATVNPTFNEVWVVRSGGNAAYFAPSRVIGGLQHFSRPTPFVWASSVSVHNFSSHAVLRGQSYLFAANGAAIQTIDATTGVLTDLPGVALPPATLLTGMIGMLSVGNYLLLYSKSAIYWSSPSNEADFVPSLITGAGFTVPTDLRGDIIACHSCMDGFIIYTTTGILSATYSGNAQYPWIFKALQGGGVIRDREHSTHTSQSDALFAWTSSGFLRVTKKEVKPAFPELTELVNRAITESFSVVSGVVQTPYAADTRPGVYLTQIGNRYLCISLWGVESATQTVFSSCFIYDLELQRWGNIQTPHVEILELITTTASEYGKAAIGIVTSTGAVSRIATGHDSITGVNYALTEPWLIFGRISLARDGVDTLIEINQERSGSSAETTTTHLMSNFTGSMEGAFTQVDSSVTTVSNNGVTHKKVPVLATAKTHFVAINLHGQLHQLEVVLNRAGKM